jgi:hypothetical protein
MGIGIALIPFTPRPSGTIVRSDHAAGAKPPLIAMPPCLIGMDPYRRTSPEPQAVSPPSRATIATWSREGHGLKPRIEAARKRLHDVLAIAPAKKLARVGWAVLNKSRNFEIMRTLAPSSQPA